MYIHFASPIILLAFFLLAFTAHSIATASKDAVVRPSTEQTGPGGKPLPAKTKRENPTVDFSPARKLLFIWLSVGTILTFVGSAVVVILHAVLARREHWWCGESVAVCHILVMPWRRKATSLIPSSQIYVIASFFVYTLILISLVDTKPSPTAAHFSTWIVALMLELMLLGASLAVYSSRHREPTVGDPHGGQRRHGVTQWEAIEILLDFLRIIFLLGLVLCYGFFTLHRFHKLRKASLRENGSVLETASLMNGHQAEDGDGPPGGYGTVSQDQTKEETSGWVRPDKVPSKSWWEYIRGYSLFFPYLWPAKSLQLQVTVVICFILVMLARVVNVLVPYQVRGITNTLAGEKGNKPGVPWGQICLYVLYRVLQGGNGLLGALRGTLWIPISQYSYQELSTASFEHVHGLSLDFHLGKKTGEVLSALSKGNSINTFLEQVTFQVFPMLIDLAVAIGYFLIAFDAYYALVVAIVTFAYLYLTIRLAQWRAEIRREMVNSSRQEDAVK